jgi:peroxiredoxin
MLVRVMLLLAIALVASLPALGSGTHRSGPMPPAGLSAPDGRIEGRVVDAEHVPWAGIRVILGELGHALLFYNTPGEMFATTPGVFAPENKRFALELATDREGRFAATGLAAGEFSLIAADKERGIALAQVRVEADGTATVEMALQPAGFLEADITGIEFDPQKNTLELSPVSQGANIQLAPRTVQRDRQWSFQSAPLPAIRGWCVIATEVVPVQDFRATLFALPVSFAPGEHRRLAIDVARGNELAGAVVDARGEPLSGVSVVARDRGDPPAERGAVTDAKGRYRLRGLASGPHTIEVSRWKMRETVGCGNGSQDVSATREVELPVKKASDVDFRIESLLGAPKVGDPAPSFSARKLDGSALDLGTLRGKVVLIDFWATWCGMCRMEMSRLLETYEQCAKSGRFEIIGVSVDIDVGLVPRFVASRGLRWPQTALGGAAKNSIARLFNVNSTPSTVLIDPAGRIAALNLTGEPLRAKIEELLRAK